MRRTVFLHVGKHKTGTTSIQLYLDNNSGFFAGKGMNVVRHGFDTGIKTGFPRTNCVDIAHCIIRPELETPIRLLNSVVPTLTYPEQLAEAVHWNKRLKAMAGDKLILSAEAFSFLRSPAEREVFDLLFHDFDVRAIMFFRESSDWMKSWKNQTAALLEGHKQLEGGADTIFDYDQNSWLVDDLAIEEFFQTDGQLFRFEQVLELHNSVIPAFLGALDLSAPECPPWQNYWYNRS